MTHFRPHVSVAAVLLALLCLQPGLADTHTTQQTQAAIITAQQLIELALSKPELLIIDSRVATDRQYGYIEPSISLPDVDTDCDSLAALVPSKTTPLVFYCNGPACKRSARATTTAVNCGYRDSYWFRGGFQAWTEQHFPTLVD